jgi:hypothetical protein
MDEQTIMETIERAINEIVVEQKEHLARGRVERTFTTDFANKLKPFFEKGNITVDPFYNKRGNDPKKLDGGTIEVDITIHERGEKPDNLVAIELETFNTPKRDDIKKLKGLTLNGGDYEYDLGLFFAVGTGKRAGEILDKEWYKNGELM